MMQWAHGKGFRLDKGASPGIGHLRTRLSAIFIETFGEGLYPDVELNLFADDAEV